MPYGLMAVLVLNGGVPSWRTAGDLSDINAGTNATVKRHRRCGLEAVSLYFRCRQRPEKDFLGPVGPT